MYMTFLFVHIIAFSSTVRFSYMHLLCAQCIYMRVYIYVYMYVFMHGYMCACVYIYICVCMYVYVYMYMCTYKYIYIYIYTIVNTVRSIRLILLYNKITICLQHGLHNVLELYSM